MWIHMSCQFHKPLLLALLFILAGCDSGTPETSPEMLDAKDTTQREASTQPKGLAVQTNASRANSAEPELDKIVQQGIALTNQVLPGYKWDDNTHLPLSSVAPDMDELDVMNLLLKFEDHYQTDITMGDLAAAIGRDNVDEARHHLTLERIARLVIPDLTKME